MPAIKFPSPMLYLSSESSFFAVLDVDNKNLNLKEVTRIDFPLIEKEMIQKENLVHALKSLEQKSLHLIASDEIFYHHISDYTLDAKKNIEEEIKKTVSTVFSDKIEPLHIVTVDLAKTSKMQTVQITAMSKTNLSILAEAAKEAGVTIESILPASFVVKAFVSVDPSLFLLVTPHNYLLTSHYIGVDFAQNLSKDDNAELIDTIKTLKAEHPHIQHIYICADSTVETALNDELKEVLPIQDVEMKEIKCENDTPFFLKALTIGVKEVIENDFPLPHFSVDHAEPSTPLADKKMATKIAEEKVSDITEKKTVEPIAEILKEVQQEKIEEKAQEEKQQEKTADAKIEKIETEEEKAVTVKNEVETEEKISEKKTMEPTKQEEVVSIPSPTVISTPSIITPPKMVLTAPAVPIALAATPKVVTPPKLVITPGTVSATGTETQKTEPKTIEPPKVVAAPTTESKASISTGLNVRPPKKINLFKYILLALGVALLISLIGGGVVISQQAFVDKKAQPLQTPISEASPTVVPEKPTSTPKPTETPIDLKKVNILVVNATSVAGKAGKVSAAIKKAGVSSVDAGNAKDKYETGNFIMIAKPELAGAQLVIEKATDLSFDTQDMSSKENPNGKYDIVIVLNE